MPLILAALARTRRDWSNGTLSASPPGRVGAPIPGVGLRLGSLGLPDAVALHGFVLELDAEPGGRWQLDRAVLDQGLRRYEFGPKRRGGEIGVEHLDVGAVRGRGLEVPRGRTVDTRLPAVRDDGRAVPRGELGD